MVPHFHIQSNFSSSVKTIKTLPSEQMSVITVSKDVH